jgi:hypothetical protein
MHWRFALAAFLCGFGGGLVGGAVAVAGRFSYWHGYKDGAKIAHDYMRAVVEKQDR